MHVTFVVPPVLSVVRPSIGVSTLAPILLSAGISCNIAYENHAFASEIGLELNEWIAMETAPQLLLGDWLFSTRSTSCAATEDPYLAKFWKHREENFREELLSARKLAQTFVIRSAERLLDGRPDVIGFSSLFQQTSASLAIAREIKRLSPSTVTCMGGANCEGQMGSTLAKNFEQIDHVFSGEAEHSFLAFLRHLEDGGDHCLLDRHLVGDREVNMESLPTPLYHDYFASLRRWGFLDSVDAGLLVETSRGCWWGAKHHCKFCGLNGTTMAFRSKSADKVYAEIHELVERYETKRLEMTDNIVPQNYLASLFPRLAAEREETGIEMFFEVKANLNFEQLKVLASAGVSWVQPGIESLSDHVLQLMDKGVSALQNIVFLRSCIELGMRAQWSILHGFPGETEQDYFEMELIVPLLEHLQSPMGCAQLRLDRFSPYFSNAAEHGFIHVRPFPAYSYVYDQPEAVLNGMAYFFYAASDKVNATVADGLTKAVADWKKSFFDPTIKPMLIMLDLAGRSIVIDSRKVAKKRMTVLAPVQAQFLAQARLPQSLNRLVTQTEISKAALDELIEAGFVVLIGERVASLVCESDRRIIPNESFGQFPGGSVKKSVLPVGSPSSI
jgi:ribosomal peptide maturation radical SAM protein 1